MSATASESLSPHGEPQATARRKRLVQLALMVFELMIERYQGVTCHDFDGMEDAALIDALRACSFYTDQIDCRDLGDRLVVELKGTDGHDYFIQFSAFGPGFSVHASRVRITKLSLVERANQVHSILNYLDLLEEYSQKLKIGNVSTDRAFLIGMSLVIGFMDEQGEGPEEDARLAPLVAQVMPTTDEFREIRAKVTPSSINYDEEGDQPF